ncbi:cupin domain-containing protein [candidate division KSB1 bacterium]
MTRKFPGLIRTSSIFCLLPLLTLFADCAFFQGEADTAGESRVEIPIMIRSLEDGQVRVVTAGEVARWPAFSNDGRRLTYYSDKLGSEDIYSVNLDDGQVSRLTSDESDENRPTWTADGQRVVYTALRNGNLSLFSSSRSGGLAQQITMDRADEVAPSFSRDGRHLVFQSNRKGSFDIWVMEVASGTIRQLTFDPAHDGTPTISPDGKTVAFDSDRSGNWDLYLIPLQGGLPRQLTKHEADDARPNWTPDGRFIIYASFQRGTIMRIPVKGGASETLIDLGPGGLDSWGFSGKSLSPDGKLLAFSQVIDTGVAPVVEEPDVIIRRGPLNLPGSGTDLGEEEVREIQTLLESEFNSRLRFLRETNLPPRESIGLERHRTAEVYCVVRGRGTIIIEGEKAELGAAEAVLTESGQEHGLLNTGDDELIVLIFKARARD